MSRLKQLTEIPNEEDKGNTMSDASISKVRRQKKRHKQVRKLIVWVILIALAVGAVYLFVLPRFKAAATITYDSYTTARGSISNSLSFSGSIDVVNDETLSAEAAGTVRKIYVGEGDRVAMGDRLIRLSNGEILKAGFDGEVNQIDVEEGDEVSANDSLIEIVDFDNLEVSIRVDEYSMASVSVGQMCKVTVTALDQTFESQITHIDRIPAGGSSTSYYTVTAQFAGSADVLPGMQVTVVIPEEKAENVVILNSNALSFGQSNNAFVYKKNDAGEMEQIFVNVGVSNDRFVEITAGLSEEETVYKVVEGAEESGGFASLFSSLPANRTNSQTAPDTRNSEFGGGFNRDSDFNGGRMP